MDKKEQKCVIYLCHVATDVTYKQAFCYHFNDLKEYAAINETPLGLTFQFGQRPISRDVTFLLLLYLRRQ